MVIAADTVVLTVTEVRIIPRNTGRTVGRADKHFFIIADFVCKQVAPDIIGYQTGSKVIIIAVGIESFRKADLLEIAFALDTLGGGTGFA